MAIKCVFFDFDEFVRNWKYEFKIHWGNTRVGSTPTFGTTNTY